MRDGNRDEVKREMSQMREKEGLRKISDPLGKLQDIPISIIEKKIHFSNDNCCDYNFEPNNCYYQSAMTEL